MRFSNSLIPTLKEVPADATLASHQLMLRAGMIRQVASGIYTYLPLGWRVLQKVSQIIREEMASVDAYEIMMPMVQPKSLWEQSGRWGAMGDQMAKFKDAKGSDYCLGPTHEEVITELLKFGVKSYKSLPKTLFQIQTKFRDEIRPRFGLMRGREFIMKDAYSFCASQSDSDERYVAMFEAYKRIFTRCGLKFAPVEAVTGDIGGSKSHEFQVLADSGEDCIAFCEACSFAGNVELAFGENFDSEAPPHACPKCKAGVKISRGIEVGHIFNLGTKYSESMGAKVLNDQGREVPMEMGCFGIGVGRTAAAAIEQSHDDKGIVWPKALAPFQIHLVSIGKGSEFSEQIEGFYRLLVGAGLEVLFDDRNERPGVKMKDAELIGCPYRVVFGKKALSDGMVEISTRSDGSMQEIALDKIVSYLKSL